MRYLADENVASPIVAWLRARGHDVLYAAETGPGFDDAVWLARAEQEQRILVTSDKDFGDMIFRDGISSRGVVLLRLEKLSMSERLKRLDKVWVTAESTHGSFIVITERRVRVRPLWP